MLGRLATWFSGQAGLDAALKSPDVLAICLPLVRGDSAHSPSQTDITSAVRVGFCSIGRRLSTRGRLLRLFFLPAMILVTMAALTVLFSVTIIPQFESIFDDFGIEPPKLTWLVFKLAWVVRNGWLMALGCLAGIAALACLMSAATRSRRVVGESWLEQRCKTTRNATAGWAWHVAMLLESGIAMTNAIEIAAKSQFNRWVQRACRNWINSNSTQMSGGSSRSPEFGSRFPLIQTSLGVNNRAAQVDLLREISTYYWDRNRAMGDWWIQWLVSILIWILVTMIVLLVVSLYAPMFAIISGLTWGGVGRGGSWWPF